MRLDQLVLCVWLAITANAFIPPTVTSNKDIQRDDLIGRFVEIPAGETIHINCSSPSGERLEFFSPNLTDNRQFLLEEHSKRKNVIELVDGIQVLIENAKESDTGSYVCQVKDDPSLSEQIHVFVSEGSRAFVPAVVDGLTVSEENYTVPCKSSRHIAREDMLLYVNNRLWKNANKHYDPRFGFKLNGKSSEEKLVNQVPFKCVYTGTPQDEMIFLITPSKPSNNENLELLNDLLTPFPYVGGPFSFECMLKLQSPGKFDNKFQHHLNATCPNCKDKARVLQSRRLMPDRIVHFINLTELTTDDAGNYTCFWYFEGEFRQERTVDISISPKKGQVQEESKSATDVFVNEGESTHLNVKIRVFPHNDGSYKTKWTRKFLRPQKTVNETEVIVADNDYVINGNSDEMGIQTETLTINKAQLNYSGWYVLNVEILDTLKTFEWNVNVLREELDPKINIMTKDSFIHFDQPYYETGTQLTVVCVASTLPAASVMMQKKKASISQWWQIDAQDMTPLVGSYENGYQWDTVLDDDVDIKCIAERGSQTESDFRRVLVSDGHPQVTSVRIKSAQATESEDAKEIYEGDTVLLSCHIPNDHDRKTEVMWLFKDSEHDDVAEKTVNHTRIITANVKDITAEQSGLYTCLVTKNNKEMRLNQTITVTKTSKPQYVIAPDDQVRKLRYGENATFDCNMEGTPVPTYSWTKNGVSYSEGELSDNGRRLFIARVAVEDKGEFECVAINRAGATTYAFRTKVEGTPKPFSRLLAFTLSVLVMVLTVIVGFVFVMYMRQRRQNKQQVMALTQLQEQLMRTSDNPVLPSSKLPLDQRVQQLPYNRKFEIEESKLVIGEKLGQGNFGVVKKGRLSVSRVSDSAAGSLVQDVAVKMPLVGTNVEQQRMLADELKILCAIGRHPNVLALVGAVTRSMASGKLYVVVEFCENGNLKDYICQHRMRFINELKEVKPADDGYLKPDSQFIQKYASEENTDWSSEMESDRLLPKPMLATSDLISFSWQIARGMEYLANRPCIHRDLAARNVLITSNKICRIADFGLAKSDEKTYYMQKKTQQLPFRWMSIEAMESRIFTQESDVWSYGITLYEIFTLGGVPYPTVNQETLMETINGGFKNPRPKYCHNDIYNLMLRCWELDPNERPNFFQCAAFMQEHLKLASPQMFDRVTSAIQRDAVEQEALGEWISPGGGEDYREAAATLTQHTTDNEVNEQIRVDELQR